MNCEECNRLERLFLESFVFADRAQTSVRCFLITHQQSAGVSDLDEYLALRAEERRTLEQRHNAYLARVRHEKDHGPAAAESGAQNLAEQRR